MPGNDIPQPPTTLPDGGDQHLQQLDEILQLARDLDVPLTLDELLLATGGKAQNCALLLSITI